MSWLSQLVPAMPCSFLILVHATLGPFFATPRTATVPFSIGIAPNLPKSMHGIGLLIYSAIFFAIVFFFSIKEGKITDLIGKFLNPIFLLLLFGIFLLAFMKPLGSAQSAAATTAYQGNSFANGFLQGQIKIITYWEMCTGWNPSTESV